MAKGIAVATGIVVAGLLGAILFVSTVPTALMNFLSEGTSVQDGSDFDKLVSQMNEVCDEEKQSVTGGISLYDGSISFENSGNKVKVIRIKNSERQQERRVNCPLDDESLEITGTTGYTISKDSGRLIMEKDKIEEM